MVGLYMTVVDSTIVFTALPSVARNFHESLAAAQWVTLSYLLSLAVFVPSSGWIGDRFGTRGPRGWSRSASALARPPARCSAVSWSPSCPGGGASTSTYPSASWPWP